MTLEEALIIIEEQGLVIKKLELRITQLEEVIRKLTKQSSPPTFPRGNYSQERNDTNKESKKRWSKKKKQVSIDRSDRVVGHMGQCDCGSTHFKILRSRKKIVQGIIIKRDTVAYQLIDQECMKCHRVYKAHMDESHFSYALRSWISIWKYELRMTHPLIAKLLSELGIEISDGEISNILLENGKKLEKCYTYLRTTGIKVNRYLQTDATGSKRRMHTKMKQQHMQFVGNPHLSIFKITDKYNQDSVYRSLTKRGINKVFVGDDATSNHIGRRQICWIHELRHYQKIAPVLQKNKQIRDRVIHNLQAFYHEAKMYGHDPTDEKKRYLEDQFHTITSQMTGYSDIDGCLKRTAKKEQELLLFLKYPYIPIHNNQSELSLRKAVVIRHISHNTKSIDGDISLARHLSVFQTLQKQMLPVYDSFHQILRGTFNLNLLVLLHS